LEKQVVGTFEGCFESALGFFVCGLAH
jgi:hypothetical protein